MMKLKLLVVATAIAALPAMGHAQSMSKDSMMKKDSMMMKDSMMKHDDAMMKKDDAMMKHDDAMMKHDDAMMKKPMKGKMSGMKTPPMDGTSCPMKCPSSTGAAGLTGTQFLALQQELRDRGCGNAHVTGRLDSSTRRAIATCATKMNVANKAAAVLVAMNIGYSDADVMGKM